MAKDDTWPGLTLTKREAAELDPAIKNLYYYYKDLAAKFGQAATGKPFSRFRVTFRLS